ncbi:Clavaminate synthase-like protein [Aspergillus saccharolyticus JOP 1030-1]|uniref:Clavaminate synthase-like protein n=1 Tax=Aspergillus saccharolyticus JOP 1030-1 TaxID=1450539 RepID=A0A318Z7T1_9EURO|nr:Clavaminate synthase-like protein [Aspergillus saccharolyticus JOP 1030-1]PYH43179.1 Clavaminate synthase-like protein [Aspergillus saccharolyticus JOP 1030-1]
MTIPNYASSDATDFPPDLPVAELQTLNLGRLQAGDQDEAQRLLEASRHDGAFYLELAAVGSEIFPVLESVYDFSEKIFDLPLEEKCLYDVDKLGNMKCNGYKPVGRNFGGLEGQRDGFETYVIPKNGILNLDNQQDFPRPKLIDQNMNTLRQFTNFVNTTSQTIFDRLSHSLELPESGNLKLCHRSSAPSPDIIRLLKYQPQPAEQRGVPHAAHTDMGTLTFLFTRQPGLQIQSPGDDCWKWVLPKAGHAIVNLGDGLSMLTNGYLQSCVHRVGPLPNRAMPTRYSFAYMVRPENQTVMGAPQTRYIPARESDAPVLTSQEWLEKKYSVLRLDARPTELAWMMTGQKSA